MLPIRADKVIPGQQSITYIITSVYHMGASNCSDVYSCFSGIVFHLTSYTCDIMYIITPILECAVSFGVMQQ